MRAKVKVTSSIKTNPMDILGMYPGATEKFTITFPASLWPNVTVLKVYMPDGTILSLDNAQVSMQ